MTETLAPRTRKVKILATLGPASSSAEMIRRLMLAGADAFRINMSHGDQKQKAKLVDHIRALEKEFKRPTTILFDLQGPKLRVGHFKGGRAALEKGTRFIFDQSDKAGDGTRVQLPHPELFEAVRPGTNILIDDGKVRLNVVETSEDQIVCEVKVGGPVSDNKGVNVPDVVVPIPALTDKDRDDLQFALEQRTDWIALSFVQRPEDVAEARTLIGDRASLLAKIEKPAAIDRLDDIVALSDAVMVARGDLGVELPPERVPPLQNKIVATARQYGKPVV
ncbi:MAG: pyruvate kinase, partial [Sphingomicrobium sp.]